MLALIFTLALDQRVAAAPPDGTYAYAETSNGRPAGTTSVVIKRNAGVVTATEFGKLSAMGQSIRAETALALDVSLAPTSYKATYTVGPRVIHAAIAFSNGTASETSDNGNTSYGLTGGAKSFAILDGGFMAGTMFVPAQMLARENLPMIGLIPSFGLGIPLAPDAAMKPDRPATVPAGDASLTFGGHAVISIWYDPKTLVVDEVDVPSQNATVIRQP